MCVNFLGEQLEINIEVFENRSFLNKIFNCHNYNEKFNCVLAKQNFEVFLFYTFYGTIEAVKNTIRSFLKKLQLNFGGIKYNESKASATLWQFVYSCCVCSSKMKKVVAELTWGDYHAILDAEVKVMFECGTAGDKTSTRNKDETSRTITLLDNGASES